MTFHEFKRAYERVAADTEKAFDLCESAGLRGPFNDDGDGRDMTLEVLDWIEPLVIATEKAVHIAHAPREEGEPI